LNKIRNFDDFDVWYRKEVAKRLLLEEKKVSMGTFIERWLRNDKAPVREISSDRSNKEIDS